ncbi:hypothetical protein RHMOL_Rhmol07G0081100 [Rhododendron molle]|uniref:Uncharacterized protein n=1 Tax=Rhododendron molle TaxID=49168 RepID=A0ACC0MZJ7_RHOML|nr:hypothetical protein RHMOL_Rhmol07G0081100 [Rhododendron molle]
MVKAKKKELLSSAPWRGDDNVEADKFKDAKLGCLDQINQTGLMRIGRQPKKLESQENNDGQMQEGAPPLPYSLILHCRRSFLCSFNFLINLPFLQKVFSFDTVVKPLPPAMGYNITRNWNFFTRIFTQFFEGEGVGVFFLIGKGEGINLLDWDHKKSESPQPVKHLLQL